MPTQKQQFFVYWHRKEVGFTRQKKKTVGLSLEQQSRAVV